VPACDFQPFVHLGWLADTELALHGDGPTVSTTSMASAFPLATPLRGIVAPSALTVPNMIRRKTAAPMPPTTVPTCLSPILQNAKPYRRWSSPLGGV